MCQWKMYSLSIWYWSCSTNIRWNNTYTQSTIIIIFHQRFCWHEQGWPPKWVQKTRKTWSWRASPGMLQQYGTVVCARIFVQQNQKSFSAPGPLGINVCMTPMEVKLSKICFHFHSYHNSVKIPGCLQNSFAPTIKSCQPYRDVRKRIF